MGVWHLIPLGDSPGAATSALAYVKKKIENKDEEFFRDSSDKLSGIILFTTFEIKEGQRQTRSKYIDNSYGSKNGAEKNVSNNTFQIVIDFIKKEFGEFLREERGKVYFCEAKVDDLEYNIRQLAKAYLELSPGGKTGKNIWVNITGGTNIFTASLLLSSFISGRIGRIYYTFIPMDKTKFLRPIEEQNFWIDVPVIKLGWDVGYSKIFEILNSINFIEDDKLYSQIKSINYFKDLKKEDLRREILNKLHGQGLIERNNHGNRLSHTGKRILNFLGENVIKALESPSEKIDINEIGTSLKKIILF